MRKPLMAANWKMNKTVSEALALTRQICELTRSYEGVDQVLCPPSVCLYPLQEIMTLPYALGAQNVHWEERGAYTGEISPTMLCGLAEYVIIGHSERRQYFGETDETVNKKIQAALAHELIPIVCVGESQEQNERGETRSFISGQVLAALAGLSGEQLHSLVIAYEPVWAIGTGRAATAEMAGDICGLVRDSLRAIHGDPVADTARILYGGSTKPDNIRAIMQQPQIDGALIGGASIVAERYAEMVKITSDVYG